MKNKFDDKEYSHIVSSMDTFYNNTALSCRLIDEEGNELYRIGDPAEYCESIEGLETFSGSCRIAHRTASLQANALGEAYISYCPAGLVHYTVSISTGDLFRGAIIAGPVHLSEPDDYEIDKLRHMHQISEEQTFRLKQE